MNRPQMVLWIVIVALCLQVPSQAFQSDFAVAKDAQNKQVIRLWPELAPVDREQTKFEKSEARITIHPAEKPNGSAIIICPGGGYGGLVTGPEGHGIAKWLNQNGIVGVVLEYRLPKGRPFVPLLDAQRAIRIVRNQAKKWSIDPNRIGIMGFSAGGHLASTAATHFDRGDKNSNSSLGKTSCRPDFAILVYPVVSMSLDSTHQGSKRNLLGRKPKLELVKWFSNETQVTVSTPPVFLAHALDDKPVPPENSRALYRALKEKQIESKYIELPSGGHGLNGYKGPMWDRWQKESLIWLGKVVAESK